MVLRISFLIDFKANLAIQQAKLNKAQAELAVAEELQRSKEEEVRQCQELYEKALSEKQVSFSFLQFKLIP